MSLRVLIVVTHLLGAGHLTRAAAIAHGLAEAGHEVTLVSGGRPTALIRTGAFRLVQLPPVQAAAGDFRTLLDAAGEPVGPAHLAERRKLLLAALAETRPQVVLTELFPFGRRVLTSEFEPLLEAAQKVRPRPLILSSVRDILAPPSRPEKAAETHAILARCYDAVLVHGDPTLAALEASWPVGFGVGAPLLYTGYVDPDGEPAPAVESGEILVSGGSSAAALPLYRAALDAARLIVDRPWRVLVGLGVGVNEVGALGAACPPNVVLEPARPDFRALMAASSLFVGQAGYNTAVDLLASRPRAVLVPFEEGGETEQRIRADMLAERGMATVLPEAELSGERLAASIQASLARPRPVPGTISRNGVRRTAELVAELARMRP